MISKELLMELEVFVDMHIDNSSIKMICEDVLYSKPLCSYEYIEGIEEEDIKSFIENNKKPSFSKLLLNYIDRAETKDSVIYRKARIDRRHFSKIRSNPDYHPSKNTAIALALALGLNINDTEELIGSAGYSLSDSETFDLIVKFCIDKKIFNIDDVNQALDYFSLKPLI